MNWPYVALFVLAGVGAVGVCLIVAAFVIVARTGGWKSGMQQPIAEGRWPPARRRMLIGASLGLFFAVGMTTLSLISGSLPWRERSVDEQPKSDRSMPDSPEVIPPTLPEARPRPGD